MKQYVTIVGARHYYGIQAFKIGMTVELRKNPENEYDDEAIEVYSQWDAHLGNVSNSVCTRAKGTHSAGFCQALIGDTAKAVIRFIYDDMAIAEVETDIEMGGM